jgi:hypothetical protein
VLTMRLAVLHASSDGMLGGGALQIGTTAAQPDWRDTFAAADGLGGALG